MFANGSHPMSTLRRCLSAMPVLLLALGLALTAPGCAAPGQAVSPDTASDFAFIEVLLQG
jgi:hypothetical protein